MNNLFELKKNLQSRFAQGTNWYTVLGAQSAQAIDKEGWPDPSQELWRFSAVSQVLSQSFELPAEKISAQHLEQTKTLIESLGASNAQRFVFLDGALVESLSDSQQAAQYSLKILLPSGLAKQEDLSAYFNPGAFDRVGAFWHLNQIAFTQAALLRVAQNQTIAKPFEFVFVSTRARLSSPRLILVLEAGAQAQVVERCLSLEDAPSCANAVIQADLGRGAVLNFLKIQEESEQACHIGHMQVAQRADSQFHACSAFSGGRFSRQNLNVRLMETGAFCALNGLYYGEGNQHLDHHLLVDHLAPHCSSRQLYKGILTGSAQAIFDGKVIVRSNAQKTDAAQTNKNLLLSKTARINTKPDLEIFANDVKCKHGATIGQLSEQALFYLRSRGIAENAARHMLIEAFAEEVAAGLPVEAFQSEVGHFLKRLWTHV